MKHFECSILLLFIYIPLVLLQDNIITIVPDTGVCVGESVVITCYLFPPTANGYSPFAQLSFNGSTPEPISSINSMYGSIGYVATIVIPTMRDSARIRLTISNFQVSDSNTLFGCHAVNSNDASVTPALVSGSASLAEPATLSPLAGVYFNLQSNLTISPFITEYSLIRPDTAIFTFTLHYNSMNESITTPDNASNFSTKFSIDTCYRISVSAVDCAGGDGTLYSQYFSVPGVRNGKGEFRSLSLTVIEWIYTDQTCPEGDNYYYFNSPEFFKFFLMDYDTNTVANVTEFTLNYPRGFSFTLPNPADLINGNYILIIEYFGTMDEVPIKLIPTV